MFGSRTIKTLTALLVSMTLGALALMMLETAPVEPSAQHLAAVAAPAGQAGRIVWDTEVPVQAIKWRMIVVHSSAGGAPGLGEQCHFIVAADGSIQPTDLWRRQMPGNHVHVPGRDFNSMSIGICLVGDFSSQAPPKQQLAALADLTRSLQRTLQISADRVYLHSDLDVAGASPGAAFPARAFDHNLYRG